MIRQTLLDAVAFITNGVKDIDAAKVDFLRRIILDFVGVYTVTTEGTLVEDGFLKTILKSLSMLAEGGDQYVESAGIYEYYRRAIMSGSPGVLQNPAVTVGANACRAHVVLDFDELMSAAIFAGRINARKLDTNRLRVRFGNDVDAGDMGAGIAEATLAGTLSVAGEWSDERKDWKGGARRVSVVRQSISAANPAVAVPIPDNMLIPHILLMVVDNSLRNNALLNAFTVKLAGRDVPRDGISWESLQGQNVEDYGLALASGLPPYTGAAIIDFDLERNMDPDDMLDTRKVKTGGAQLLLDVNAPTGTSYVDVVYYAVDPAGLRGQARGRGRRDRD